MHSLAIPRAQALLERVAQWHAPLPLRARTAGFLAGMAFWMRNWFMGAYCAVMATIFLVLAWGDEFM